MYAKPRSFWFRNRKLRGLCFLFRAWLCLRTNQTRLSLWERCRAATERAGSLLEGAVLPPCGKTEGVLQSDQIRMRFALTRICQRAAPSVTACAATPSSGRKALFTRNPTRLSLWERCRAATERAGSLFEGAGLPPCGKTEGAASYLSRIRQTLAQTCQRTAPSATACAVPPSSERKALFTHRPNSSLPLGEMSRSDREGRLPCEGAVLPLCGKTEGVCQIGKIRMRFALIQTCSRAAPSVTACAVPPSSGRKALVLRADQTCLSLWERCRAATERALPFVFLSR